MVPGTQFLTPSDLNENWVPCPPDSCHLWGGGMLGTLGTGWEARGSIKVPTCIWQRSIKARIPAKHHSSPKREKKIPRRSSQRPTVINRRKRPPMRTSTVWIWPCRLKRCCRCSSVGRGCHCLGRHLLEISRGQPVPLLSCFPQGSCQLPRLPSRCPASVSGHPQDFLPTLKFPPG